MNENIKPLDHQKIAVDLHGTLATNNNELLPGTKEFLTYLYKSGANLVLWTLGDGEDIEDFLQTCQGSINPEIAAWLMCSQQLYGIREAINVVKKSGDVVDKEVQQVMVRNQAKHPSLIGSNVLIDNDPYYRNENFWVNPNDDSLPNRNFDPIGWARGLFSMTMNKVLSQQN